MEAASPAEETLVKQDSTDELSSRFGSGPGPGPGWGFFSVVGVKSQI